MNKEYKLEDCMVKAIEKIETYIEQTTGTRPTQQEMADALSRYFVLKEIGDFIQMTRRENDASTDH